MSSQIVSLDSLMASPSRARGGCASSTSCGSSALPADIEPAVWEKIKDHPCYSEEAHHYFARMHVAVAPACNIQCNYCNRKYDCSNESRPGVVSERLTPDEALRKVVAVAAAVPELSVLGIAGPGDALANWKNTRATFEAVRKAIPDIKFCISTNGLALPDHVDEIADMAIDHVTITINAVDPEIGAKIYPWIFFDHKRRTGPEAATILLERQMRGLEMLTARSILVKVNSVMIPGINDDHLPEVNRAVRARGAFLHNIMPLISDPAHGTHFGLTGQRGPTPAELKTLQDRLDGGAKLMRHCRQCRADAIGLLGEDRGQDFTLEKLPETVAYDPAPRQAYRAFVAAERGDRDAARDDALRSVGAVADDVRVLVAVATKGGARVNEHFGHAREFQVFEAGPQGIVLVGHRKVDAYCMGGFGEDATLGPTIAALTGIDTVLCAKVGDCPREALLDAGITVTDAHAYDYIETAIGKVYAERFGRASAYA
ncbi:MAG: nifB [Proteobacteria bacterium]|nr:nifB [Pseudomonadota bacterium]